MDAGAPTAIWVPRTAWDANFTRIKKADKLIYLLDMVHGTGSPRASRFGSHRDQIGSLPGGRLAFRQIRVTISHLCKLAVVSVRSNFMQTPRELQNVQASRDLPRRVVLVAPVLRVSGVSRWSGFQRLSG